MSRRRSVSKIVLASHQKMRQEQDSTTFNTAPAPVVEGGGIRVYDAPPSEPRVFATPPSFRVRDSKPGIRVHDSEPGIRVQDSEPGIRVRESEPGYRVRDSEPGYRVSDSEPGYRVRESEPGYRVRDSEPGYRVRDSEPGYRVRSDPPGYRVRNDVPGPPRVFDHLPQHRVRPGGFPATRVHAQQQESPNIQKLQVKKEKRPRLLVVPWIDGCYVLNRLN